MLRSRNSNVVNALVAGMDRHDTSNATGSTMDRQVIRVENPLAHAGITEALRRAFASAPSNDDRRFEELLRRLA
jgi:hypothetical protein